MNHKNKQSNLSVKIFNTRTLLSRKTNSYMSSSYYSRLLPVELVPRFSVPRTFQTTRKENK